MELSRRQMMLISLGALASGCTTTATTYTRRPGPVWPDSVSTPSKQSQGVVYRPPTPIAPPPAAAAGPLGALPRSQWTRSSAVKSRINPMKGVRKITIHHEGSTTFWASDARATAARIEKIRAYHVNERRFGDIGYHYIIDRAGRVWEGRSIASQGAHVSKNNEHNIGVMVLGNFEKQTPTSAQLATLQKTVATLSSQYKVPKSRIYTHRELGPTTCPGRNLQPRIASLRASGKLA